MSKKPWLKPGPMTGAKPGLLQDDDRNLSKWFASRLDSRWLINQLFRDKLGEKK